METPVTIPEPTRLESNVETFRNDIDQPQRASKSLLFRCGRRRQHIQQGSLLRPQSTTHGTHTLDRNDRRYIHPPQDGLCINANCNCYIPRHWSSGRRYRTRVLPNSRSLQVQCHAGKHTCDVMVLRPVQRLVYDCVQRIVLLWSERRPNNDCRFQWIN